MLQAILELFTTKEKVEGMLASPIIEMIFMVLFGLFVLTVFIHLIVFLKIRKVRNYVRDTGRLDMEPLHSIKQEFDLRQSSEGMKIDTFIQEKFSNWQLLHIPVVSIIKLVQMTISVFILLGVLGTFIGLTISLGSIQLYSEEFIENIAQVLSGIDVAFYTSIIGMSFSLIMTVLIRLLNTEYMLTDLMLTVESLLEGHEKQGMNQMIAISKDIHTAIQSLEENNQYALNSIVEAFSGFRDYTEGLQQSAKDLAAFNKGLSANLIEFQNLFQQMTTVTEGFGEGTKQLNQNFSSLFHYFKEADHRNEQIAEVFEKTYTDFQEVADAQVHSLQSFDDSTRDIKEFTSSLLNRQTNMEKGLESINQETSKLVGIMAAHNKTFKDIFGEEVSVKLEGIAMYLSELKYGFDKVSEAFGSLPDALEIVNRTQKEHSQLLGERFRELKEFNQTFNQHLKSHVLGAAEMGEQMQNTVRTFEQLATKNSHFLNEMDRFIKDLKLGVTQRDQELTTSMGMLKDTLATHVSTVENTLSQKLETIIRNTDQGIYSMTDGMNRELIEMRRAFEEMNQSYVRLIQQSLQEIGRELQQLNRQIASVGQQPIRQANRIGMNRDEF